MAPGTASEGMAVGAPSLGAPGKLPGEAYASVWKDEEELASRGKGEERKLGAGVGNTRTNWPGGRREHEALRKCK